MSDSDDENYVYIGTALQEEVESRAGQHSKTLQDPSLTKSLPVWKQVNSAPSVCVYCRMQQLPQLLLQCHVCQHA